MSGFGTKKPGADVAQQLTFPKVYSELYADSGEGQGYFPDPLPLEAPKPVGLSLQDQYHEQKRIDANRRAMNGVRDTAASRFRFTHSHANYFGMPHAVLGQRIFANPSLGNQADIYPARRDMMSGGLRGGVLRTAEAQRWGHTKLQQRVAQLNAIDDADAAFKVGEVARAAPEPMAVSQGLPEAAGTKAHLELLGALQTITGALSEGKYDKLLISDIYKFLKLLFRVGATATREELEDIFAEVDDAMANVRSSLAAAADDFFERIAAAEAEGNDELVARLQRETEVGRKALLERIHDIMTKTREYLRVMLGNVDKSPAERKALSSATVKNLGFTKLRGTTKELEAARGKEIKRLGEHFVQRQDWEHEIQPIPDDALFALPQARFVVGSEQPMAQPQLSETGRRRAADVARREAEAHLRIHEAPRGALQDAARARFARAPVAARRAARDAAALAEMGNAANIPLAAFYEGRQRARFDAAPRNAFGARQGAYFGEALPDPEGYVPERNPRRMAPAGLPVREVGQMAPVFPDVGRQPRLGDFDVRAAIRRQMAAEAAPRPMPEGREVANILRQNAAMRAAEGRLGLPPGFIEPMGRGKAKKGRGKKAPLGMTRKTLPDTREGYVELADKLRGMGHNIRVNSGSQLKSIRANFIKKFGL